MSEDIIIIEEQTEETNNTAVSPTQATRRVILAGIGIVVVAGGEVKSWVGKLTEAKEGTEENTPQNQSALNLRQEMKTPLRSLLTRLNIPTKTDIDALNDQVTTLLNKIEMLQQLEQQIPENQTSPSSSVTPETNQTSA